MEEWWRIASHSRCARANEHGEMMRIASSAGIIGKAGSDAKVMRYEIDMIAKGESGG